MNSQYIEYLTIEEIENIKLIVFDVDGVLVPRGTKIKQESNTLTLETKVIPSYLIDQMETLANRGFILNISSGRGLYMLQNMFRSVLKFVSLTYENGSCTWYEGNLIQHINSFYAFGNLYSELAKVNHKNILGFEPKEFIITIHCSEPVLEIEDIVNNYDHLYCIWNGEAYDVGVKKIQTKEIGLIKLMDQFQFKKENVIAIGDNYNDIELLDCAGISVSADIDRVHGNYYVDTYLQREKLPAYYLMKRIIELQ